MSRTARSATLPVAAVLVGLTAASAMAATADVALDRTVLPVAEPARPAYKELDARNAQPPPRFAVKAPDGAPNVVIILIDDLGFGATSTFGGPIATRTLDSLAQQGLRYNNFHTTALCSPTRAALKAGRNHHTVNMAFITEMATGFPGATGQIPNSTAPLAEMLRLNGYSTAAFGKWHETAAWEASVSGPFDRWPTRQGFDKFYGFIGGETNQWAPYLYDGVAPVELPDDPDYHFMSDMTDKAAAWVKYQKALTPDKPAFIYFAPGATHAPHHVPKEWIARWKGKFDQGWDKIREESLARQIAMGVVPAGTKLPPKPPAIKDWSQLSPDEQRLFARQAEVFAAFVEYTDHEIGRMLKAFEDVGQADNTLVFYIAGDNGTSGEGGQNGMFNEYTYFNGVQETVPDMLKLIDQWGGPETYPHMAAGWSVAFNSPFSWMKQVPSDFGGTRNGMVVHWPKGIQAKDGLRTQFSHVIDVAPTVLEAARLPEPKVVNGTPQVPIEGKSLVYSFEDAKASGAPHHAVFRDRRQSRDLSRGLACAHDPPCTLGAEAAPFARRQLRLAALRPADRLQPGQRSCREASAETAGTAGALPERGREVPRAADGRSRLRATGCRRGRPARPDGWPDVDDPGRGHDRNDGKRVHQREEPLEDHHGRDRVARGRGQRHDSRAGRPLWRLVTVRQGRGTGVRIQLPGPAADPHCGQRAAGARQGDAPVRVRLRWRRAGQRWRRYPLRQWREGRGRPDREHASGHFFGG